MFRDFIGHLIWKINNTARIIVICDSYFILSVIITSNGNNYFRYTESKLSS